MVDQNHVRQWIPLGYIQENGNQVYEVPPDAQKAAGLKPGSNFVIVTYGNGFGRSEIKGTKSFATLGDLRSEIKPNRLVEINKK